MCLFLRPPGSWDTLGFEKNIAVFKFVELFNDLWGVKLSIGGCGDQIQL